MDEDLKDKILEQIEEQHMEPRATWRFRLERMLKHSAVAILFVLTALGLAGSVYILVQNGTLADLRLGPKWRPPGLFDFPWQLLVLVVALGILSFVVLRRTARLYRVAKWWLVAVLVVAVVAGAGAAYGTNLTRLAFRAGPGRDLFQRGGNPFGGMRDNAVIGVVKTRTTERWVVDSLTGEHWLVIVTEETYFPAGSDIPLGTIVRVVGRRVRTTIYADGIRPVTGIDDMMDPLGGMIPPGILVPDTP
ncbi:MAG: hypothetical protein NT102_00045 [Caldiserica bacterium]|nr:hypothetical protein [Caldisericota bacterium]